jgi:nicotinamide-nucleotide amidase
MTASFEKMAWVPEGSRVLHPQGHACGFYIMERGVHLYFLPGVPDQMRYLMDKFVMPELLNRFQTLPVMRQRILKVFGLNEPRLAEMFKELETEVGNVVLGFYPQFPENHITISFRSREEAAVTRELDRVERLIRDLLGPYVFASGNQRMQETVGQALLAHHMTLSVAESCTGGLIGHMLTEVPGSSHYFLGGVVVYSNPSKRDLLGVQPETLDRCGAVSNGAVQEMAMGVRERVGTDIGLAVSGVAGPGGGSPAKPVGTVHIGLAHRQGVHSEKYRFWGNRAEVKASAATMALDWVRRYLHGYPLLKLMVM